MNLYEHAICCSKSYVNFNVYLVMTLEVEQAGELKRNALSLSHLSVQGLAVIGPSITAAILITGIAGVALSATPLVFLVATVAILINVNTAIQYSKKIASSGGFFSYVSNGIGPRTGVMTGLYQLFYQINNVAFLALWNGYFIGAAYSFFTGRPVSIYIMLLIGVITLIFAVSIQYVGIKKAVGFNFVTGLIESAFLVIVSLIIILLSPSANTGYVFTPGSAGLSGVGLGMILALLSFGGYTTIVSLGEEAKSPKKNTGKAIIFTVLMAGFVFVITSYALTIGWGYSNMAAFAALPLPGFTVVNAKIGVIATVILSLIVLSANLNAINGQMVNVSRLVYRMSRDQKFPQYLGKSHKKFQTPYISLIVITGISAIVMIIAFLTVHPIIDAVFLLATMATVGTIMVHSITNISLIHYHTKIKEFKLVFSALLPIVGTALILYALYASIYPFVYPYYLAPIALAIWTSLCLIFIMLKIHNRDDVDTIGKFTL